MSHSLYSPDLHEGLQQQLLMLSNDKGRFLDEFFPKQGKERHELELLLTEYTTWIEKNISNSNAKSKPVVLIGSHITIEYLEYQTTDSFTIVLPHDADPDEGRISFLSPVGRQLLLAANGDVLSVTTPAGAMQVRIQSIHYQA